MKYFFDNTTSPFIVSALNCLAERDGNSVSSLRSKFKQNTDDISWITSLKEEGNWVIISGDTRIKKNPHEREAWLESGLTTFFLARGWMNIPFWEQAQKLVKWWPKIVDQSLRVETGNFFEVPVVGNKMRIKPKQR